jgi:ribosomal RNA-processing protein 1
MERTLLLYVTNATHIDLLYACTFGQNFTDTLVTGLWMQDKPALQQALSRDLASLVSHLRTPVVLPFLRAFWLTMSREWSHIEALRLDKYLYLIRRYLNASFEFLAKRKWKKTVIEDWNQILEETPLHPKDMKVPNGLRYHVLDIWVDELRKVSGDKWEKETGSDTLELLVEPIEKMKTDGALKVLRDAAKETLSDETLQSWRGIEVEKDNSEEESEDEEMEWGGFADE